MAAVYVRHKALYTVHGVQRHGGLLLQGGQGPVQVVLLQVLHDQTDHAAGTQTIILEIKTSENSSAAISSVCT